MKIHLSKEKQKQILLIGLFALIAVLGLYFLVISNQREKLKAAEKRISEAAANVERAKGVLKSRARIQEELAGITNQLSAIEAGMASGNDKYLWFINTLNRFKVPYANQVDIPSVSRERVTEVSSQPNFPYKAAVFSLRGTAHFHSFGRFLADFENKFPYFRVQKLTLTPAAADFTSDNSEKISFEIEVATLINSSSQ